MSIFAVSKRGFWVGLTGRFNEVREKIGRRIDVIDSRINTLTRGLFTFSHFLCTIKRLRSASQLWLIPGSLYCLPPFPLKVSRPVFICVPHICVYKWCVDIYECVMSAENACVGVYRQDCAKFRIEELAPFQFMCEFELATHHRELN